MGIEYALVNDADKTYLLLGKKIHSGEGPVGFQMHDEKIGRFIAGADPGTAFRLVMEETDEYDELEERGYMMVDEWCADFVSRRVVSGEDVNP